MKKTDQRQTQQQRHQRPSADTTESDADATLPKEPGYPTRHLLHFSTLRMRACGNIATRRVPLFRGADQVPTAASDAREPSMAYRLRASELVAEFDTNEQHGLSDEEARSRIAQYGSNELAAEKRVPAWRRFLAQFRDVLVILLLVATAISAALWAVERDAALPYEAIAIFAVVLLNATMGYIQESRAEAAVAALRAMSAADASVIRSGERRSVPAARIVPGDIILIEEGDTIPADARLIESAALRTAEAALTGESLPVAKDIDAIPGDVPLGDRDNMVFSGTAAAYGH